MDKKTLKKTLFGYSKSSVFEYIAEINEDFAEKFRLAINEREAEIQRLKNKILLLEKENSLLLEEKEQALSSIPETTLKNEPVFYETISEEVSL